MICTVKEKLQKDMPYTGCSGEIYSAARFTQITPGEPGQYSSVTYTTYVSLVIQVGVKYDTHGKTCACFCKTGSVFYHTTV